MNYKVLVGVVLAAFSIPSRAQLVSSHASTIPVNSGVPSTPAVSGKAVARVNGVVLTDKDLLREMYTIFPYAKQHGGTFPKDMEPGIRKGALQMIIFEELAYQQAQKKGMTIGPERLSSAEAEFRRQFSSPAEYKLFLQSEFEGNEQALRAKIRRSLLIDKYLKAEVDQKAVVSDAEVKAYYDKNPARFQYPESFAIQTISVIPPANATPAQLAEARKRAADAYKQAKATKTPEEFGLLAEKISDDDYRVMMGDHRWVDRSKMPPTMLDAALKMKDGEISGLIQVEQNYVVFRMNKHIPAGMMKFDDIKVDLRKQMEKNKINQVRSALDKKLLQHAEVETL
ncbi:MAG TPA: peptidyl-prolyl cis-trans isomerase [Terriglobales bacterium]|nr:peptidyl-prolyl cis-trans isomerase [Terriglobales bacterium]